MINPILQSGITEMLKDMEDVFSKFDIDYYLVGAIARDIQLGVDPQLASLRHTKDVDIAIMIQDEGQYDRLKEALVATGNFEAHKTEAIKLFYKQSIEIDLMPFGDIEESNREIRLTSPLPFVINMPGFKEIYPSLRGVQIATNLNMKVCSLEGIILLKLIANDDKPERTKDISDIEHIIKVYFELKDDLIYENYFDIMDMYETDLNDYLQLICSRVIGRKMNNLLQGSEELKSRIKIILAKRPATWWQAMLDGVNDLY